MVYNALNFKQELKKIEERLSRDYSQVHTGRATPIVLDSVRVESYGTKVPLNSVASITIEDPKTLRVVPWDKGQIKDIESAISGANLGLSVASDNEGVRAIFPALTTENRTNLTKILKEKLEDARINVRKDRTDEINKTDNMSEDEKKRAKEEIQKCVDEANKNLEAIFTKKENEVMS